MAEVDAQTAPLPMFMLKFAAALAVALALANPAIAHMPVLRTST